MIAIPTPFPVIPFSCRARTPNPGFLPCSITAAGSNPSGRVSGQSVWLSKSERRSASSSPERSADRRSVLRRSRVPSSHASGSASSAPNIWVKSAAGGSRQRSGAEPGLLHPVFRAARAVQSRQSIFFMKIPP